MTDDTHVEKHRKAMIKADELTARYGVDQKGGKKYLEVKHRVNVMRGAYGLELGIDTQIEYADEKYVRVAAKVTDTSGRVIGSGHGEELRGKPENYRGSTHVNETSALENAETSAVGRALASIGLHGGEYASLNEIEMARSHEQQLKQPPEKKPEPVPLKTVSKTDDPPFDASDTRQVPDWVEWSAQETKDIQEMTSEAALRGWLNDNEKTLIELEKAEPKLYQSICDDWNQLKNYAQKNQKRIGT